MVRMTVGDARTAEDGRLLADVVAMAEDWLAAAPGDVTGLCGHAAEVLYRAFQPRGVVWGFGYYGVTADRWQPKHNWVVLPDGTIVDPTRAQFGHERAVHVIGPDDPAADLYHQVEPEPPI